MNKFEGMQEMRVRDDSSCALSLRKTMMTARFVSVNLNLAGTHLYLPNDSGLVHTYPKRIRLHSNTQETEVTEHAP